MAADKRPINAHKAIVASAALLLLVAIASAAFVRSSNKFRAAPTSKNTPVLIAAATALKPSLPLKPAIAAPPQLAGSTPSDSTSVPFYTIYSRPFGFEPNQITVKAGLGILFIRNYNGAGGLHYLVLDRSKGENPSASSPADTSGSNDGEESDDDAAKNPPGGNVALEVNFIAGDKFTLIEPMHKNWVCQITVAQ